MKKIFLTLLAVLSILAFITACGDSTGGNPLIQPENGTGDNSTETNPTDTPSTGGGIAKSLKDRITEAKAGDIIDLGVEKLSITEGESYTISKAITIKNGDAKDGTFTVETTGAKLLNLRNINSIIADKKIQDGDLNIINCYEIDSIYVNGGGANSIHISSTTVTNLFVQKENVRVVLEAATSNEEGSNAEGQSKTATVKNVQIKTDCKLDSTDEKATFKNVQISYDVEKLILSGSANVEKILAESDETATVEIESEDVKIEKTTENVELTTPENSQIQIPSVDKIDTYYTVTVLAYPFTQGSMKLPEGFLFSFEEMIFEDAGIVLGKVKAQGKCHSGRQGLATIVHRTRGIDNGQSILIICKSRQRSPSCIQCVLLLFGDVAHEATTRPTEMQIRFYQFIGHEGISVHLHFATGNLAQEFAIAFAVVPVEGLAILEHSLGRLLGVIKGIVLLTKAILDDADVLTEFDQGLAVCSVGHSKESCDFLGISNGLGIGCVDRRQPLCKQADIVAHIHGVQICLQLLLDHTQSVFFAGGAHEAQQIVPTTVLCNVGNVLLGRSRCVLCEPLQAHAEHLSLAQATSYITGKKQSFHRQIGIFSEGPNETIEDFLLATASQCTDGCEQIQAIAVNLQICCVAGNVLCRGLQD